MKLSKEKEDRIDMRLDDLYKELITVDEIPSKLYGSVCQRLHNAVQKIKDHSSVERRGKKE